MISILINLKKDMNEERQVRKILPVFYIYIDNQFDSGFAISRALLYAISRVKQVLP